MDKFGVQLALEGVREAEDKWRDAGREFRSRLHAVMKRLMYEAAANRMSVSEVSKASGKSRAAVRNAMRMAGLDPRDGKTLLAETAADALKNNADLLGIPVHEMDLMSPLAYLPMGSEMRQAIIDATTKGVTELPDVVSGNAPDSTALADRLYRAIVLRFEGIGEAWTTDDSGDTLARAAAEVALAELGICHCGESMPCLSCGRGL